MPFTTTPAEALQRLQDGNHRFVSGLRSVAAIARVPAPPELAARGQKPFAAVLACADSRVPTEFVFDCGLGELFVTRLAGNVVTPHIIASLEFGALHLGTSLIVVMGHTGCGAVKAAVAASEAAKSQLTHSLQVLVNDVKPAVAAAKVEAGGSAKDLLRAVERENVRLGCVDLLQRSEALAKLVKDGKIEIVGALFHLETGRVEFGLEAGTKTSAVARAR
jgi:carbonic anhydrase